MQYVITNHCIQRFRSRFRYKFHDSYFLNNSLIESLIISLVQNSSEDDLIKYSPFYKNKFTTVYSHNATLYRPKRKDMVFAVKIEYCKIITVTVFEHFDVRSFIQRQ